jgi:cell division transport system ATP-binding protein
MLEFHQVTKRYRDGHEALRKVSFTVERGEFVFLTGHSGAGKSTLLKLVPLIERPSEGDIRVGGVSLQGMPQRRIPALRRSMGLVFQDYRLIPDRSVFDNVALPLQVSGAYTTAEAARRVRAALDKVGLLHKEQELPPSLSGGEQQRVGIARAVVARPPLLLADEPTGNLDPPLSVEILGLFAQFARIGVTVLVATHDLGLIKNFPYRVLSLRHGEVCGPDEECA